MTMLPFTPYVAPAPLPIQTASIVPNELDIFSKGEQQFLPDGKTFAELTPAEEKRLKSQYRFSPFRPGIYQGITGMAHSI